MGMLISIPPMMSLSLKSCFGLRGWALWQLTQLAAMARSGARNRMTVVPLTSSWRLNNFVFADNKALKPSSWKASWAPFFLLIGQGLISLTRYAAGEFAIISVTSRRNVAGSGNALGV